MPSFTQVIHNQTDGTTRVLWLDDAHLETYPWIRPTLDELVRMQKPVISESESDTDEEENAYGDDGQKLDALVDLYGDDDKDDDCVITGVKRAAPDEDESYLPGSKRRALNLWQHRGSHLPTIRDELSAMTNYLRCRVLALASVLAIHELTDIGGGHLFFSMREDEFVNDWVRVKKEVNAYISPLGMKLVCLDSTDHLWFSGQTPSWIVEQITCALGEPVSVSHVYSINL